MKRLLFGLATFWLTVTTLGLALVLAPVWAGEKISIDRLHAVADGYVGREIGIDLSYLDVEMDRVYWDHRNHPPSKFGRLRMKVPGYWSNVCSTKGVLCHIYVPISKTSFLDYIKPGDVLHITAVIYGSEKACYICDPEPILRITRIRRDKPYLDLELRLKSKE